MTDTLFKQVNYTVGALVDFIGLGQIGLPDIQRLVFSVFLGTVFHVEPGPRQSVYRGVSIRSLPGPSGLNELGYSATSRSTGGNLAGAGCCRAVTKA